MVRLLPLCLLALCLVTPLALAHQPDPQVAHYYGNGLASGCVEMPDWQRGWGVSWLAGCGFGVAPGAFQVFVQDAWSHDVGFSWVLLQDDGTVCAEGHAVAHLFASADVGCGALRITPLAPAVAGEIFVI